MLKGQINKNQIGLPRTLTDLISDINICVYQMKYWNKNSSNMYNVKQIFWDIPFISVSCKNLIVSASPFLFIQVRNLKQEPLKNVYSEVNLGHKTFFAAKLSTAAAIQLKNRC